jgi:hypothetical protein
VGQPGPLQRHLDKRQSHSASFHCAHHIDRTTTPVGQANCRNIEGIDFQLNRCDLIPLLSRIVALMFKRLSPIPSMRSWGQMDLSLRACQSTKTTVWSECRYRHIQLSRISSVGFIFNKKTCRLSKVL